MPRRVMARGGKLLVLAEHVVHHHDVGHRRIDRAHAVLAVQPLLGEGERRVDRALAQRLRKIRLDHAQDVVERRGTAGTSPSSDAAPWQRGRWSCGSCRNNSSMPTPFGLRAQRLHHRQHHQRHDGGARPIGNLVEVERRPHRQQHDLDRQQRHRAPGQTPYIASVKRVKTLLWLAPPRERIASRARTICGLSTESPIIFSAK